jgi:peptide/nickel transport system substrate-binding protein
MSITNEGGGIGAKGDVVGRTKAGQESQVSDGKRRQNSETEPQVGKVGRRDVLKMGSALAISAAAGPIIAATGGVVPLAPVTARAQGTYSESPLLADRVAAGQLPPVVERLPGEPFVVGPGVLLQEEYLTWENGQYGGAINHVSMGTSGLMSIAGGGTILRSPSQTTEASRPNVVSEFSVSEDSTTFRFKIRDGLKWSDGTPVTTEDVRFTFEDLYLNPDALSPWPTPLYTQGNTALEPARLTVVDPLAFELTFGAPYGYFVAELNSWIPGYNIIFKPAHYLKQFHATYADPGALNALVAESGEPSWGGLLSSRIFSHWEVGEVQALGLPALDAWVLIEASESQRIFERNPYFWHVDSAGQQLPYIDRVTVNIAGDNDAVSNAILAGQVTLATGNEVALSNMPIYQQNTSRSGIRVFTTGSFNYPLLLFLNHDFQYEDPASLWQQLVADPSHRFGRALAAAMDPVDVSQSVYFGLYGQSLLNNTGQNLGLATQLLDELGMTSLDGDGYRLGPDGNPFVLRVTNPQEGPDFAPVAVLLRDQLGAAGIRVEIENVSVQLWNERKETNEIMAGLHWNDGPAWASGLSEDYLPLHKGPWSPMTWLHFTSQGREGRQPPEYLQEFYRLHTTRREFLPASPEGQAIFAQLLQWLTDNYVFIPTTGAKVGANVVDARLRNVSGQDAPFELDTYINAEGYWFPDQ